MGWEGRAGRSSGPDVRTTGGQAKRPARRAGRGAVVTGCDVENFKGKVKTPAGGASGGLLPDQARGGGAGPWKHRRERPVTSLVYPTPAESQPPPDPARPMR